MRYLKHSLVVLNLILCSGLYSQQASSFVPLTKRVDIQSEVAPSDAIIDNQWVAVGTKKKHAIGYDNNVLFQGKPSFLFTLKEDDNTLSGYKEGDTKGRAELSFCYATADDLKKLTKEEYNEEVLAKTIYHHGKGACAQGSTMYYRFSIYVPSSLSTDVNTIFAQWHGMPDRTLVKTPEGVIKQISKAEFAKLCETMTFKKDMGYNKGDNKPNGWLVEQGGYPPLAFGFVNEYFYIKANSDRKWLSDKTDRCNIEPLKGGVMKPRKSTYKTSTLAYKAPFNEFPKNKWVTFYIKVEWSKYGSEKEEIEKPGVLDVNMCYDESNKEVSKKIVDNQTIMIGRNDKYGYYFKFGIYRVGNSKIPVSYNLANYAEQAKPFKIK